MSPIESIPGNQILDEAEKIKNRLLDVESQSQALADEREGALIELLAQDLGFDQVPSVDDAALTDTRIDDKEPVISPRGLETLLGRTVKSIETVQENRNALKNIINHDDDRLAVVVGPCSIHDPSAALLYATQVAEWRSEFGADLEVMMRTYMEKPRTELGWKGFIYDPKLDESDDINTGIVATRMLANQITNLGVPIAMERLNALTPQYVNGLVGYDVIGARNATDQKAREYGSGTSSAIGVKNTVDGSIQAAAEAVVSINGPHSFLGMSLDGSPAQVKTQGNDTAHVVLRGSDQGPNYSAEDVAAAKAILEKKGLKLSLVVDASHGNSGKKAENQMNAVMAVSEQVALGEMAICGVMVESNLRSGRQELVVGKELEFGVSITDECVDVDTTKGMLELLSAAVQKRRTIKG